VTLAHALDWLQRLLWTATLVGSPAVALLVVVGIVVSILQAATQVNDSAVGFAPKVLAMLLVLVVGGEWMFMRMRDFAAAALEAIATLGPGA